MESSQSLDTALDDQNINQTELSSVRARNQSRSRLKSQVQTNVTFHSSPDMVKRSIRFPAKINSNSESIEKAVKMVGGYDAINTVFSDNSKRLELCFHPESKRVSMVSSKVKPVCRILMKVQKIDNQTNTPDEENSDDNPRENKYNVELTPISHYIGFESLCDFQFLKKPRMENQQVQNQYLSLIPGKFLHFKKTYDYKFKSKARTKKKTHIPIFIVSINEDKPQYYVGKECKNINDPRQDIPLSSDPATQLLRNCLRRLFEIRPIWRRRAIAWVLGNHPFLTSFRIKANLSYFAYTLKDGPWNHLLIRYGVDPKSNPKYSIYQNMYFRIPRPLREFVEEGFREHSHYLFKGLPEQWNTTYCLCDIRLRRVVDIVKKPQLTYNPTYGFYTEDDWITIRNIMKEKVHEVINSLERHPNLDFINNDPEILQVDEFHNIPPEDFDFAVLLRRIEANPNEVYEGIEPFASGETDSVLNTNPEENEGSSDSDSSIFDSDNELVIEDDEDD